MSNLNTRDMQNGPWILTYTGQKVSLPIPGEDSINIDDIAHHLSLVNRFTGASKFPYSVAQHSVYVSYLVPEKYALEGLLHDATEAYLGDVNSPLKSLLPEYKVIEGAFQKVVSRKFNVLEELPKEVKEADSIAYFIERDALLPKCKDFTPYKYTGKELPIVSMFPKQAEEAFITRYLQLKLKRDSSETNSKNRSTRNSRTEAVANRI